MEKLRCSVLHYKKVFPLRSLESNLEEDNELVRWSSQTDHFTAEKQQTQGQGKAVLSFILEPGHEGL